MYLITGNEEFSIDFSLNGCSPRDSSTGVTRLSVQRNNNAIVFHEILLNIGYLHLDGSGTTICERYIGNARKMTKQLCPESHQRATMLC